MIEDVYQLAYELSSSELYFLKDKRHMKSDIVRRIMEDKYLKRYKN